jgi:D-glycero-alpha-D-manno-heptose 1-phosphate guanylyltransferase
MALINGKPFLHYIFKSLKEQNIESIILSVGYKNEIIKDFFKDNYLGITVKYAIEEEPLGTGGAIKHAFSLVDDDAFVLNGDTFFNVDLSTLKNENTDISIALKPMQNFDRYGTVELNTESRIISFNEKKQCENGIINGGVYYFKKSLFDKIKTSTKFSFEKDILEKHVLDLHFQGIIFDAYFIDIGIPEDFYKAQTDFK